MKSRVTMALTYGDAGVDRRRAARVVARAREVAQATRSPAVCAHVGGFAGSLNLPGGDRLVLTVDGVGTKALLALPRGRARDLGVDLVAMGVNDLVAAFARPVAFLDYMAMGRLDPATALTLLEGVQQGCQQAGCPLLGGETAELPDMLAPGHLELVGFAVGLEEGHHRVEMAPGDLLGGLASSGPHANGFSLIRRLVEGQEGVEGLIEAALAPTRIYVPAAQALRGLALSGWAHITGGGLAENLCRILPEGLMARVHPPEPPPLFQALAALGPVSDEEMVATFNMGVGMVFACRPEAWPEAVDRLEALGEGVMPLGEVVPGPRRVERGEPL